MSPTICQGAAYVDQKQFPHQPSWRQRVHPTEPIRDEDGTSSCYSDAETESSQTFSLFDYYYEHCDDAASAPFYSDTSKTDPAGSTESLCDFQDCYYPSSKATSGLSNPTSPSNTPVPPEKISFSPKQFTDGNFKLLSDPPTLQQFHKTAPLQSQGFIPLGRAPSLPNSQHKHLSLSSESDRSSVSCKSILIRHSTGGSPSSLNTREHVTFLQPLNPSRSPQSPDTSVAHRRAVSADDTIHALRRKLAKRKSPLAVSSSSPSPSSLSNSRSLSHSQSDMWDPFSSSPDPGIERGSFPVRSKTTLSPNLSADQFYFSVLDKCNGSVHY